jgi:hypothetical protein
MKRLALALLLAAALAAGTAFAARVVESCPQIVQLQMAPVGCRLGSAIAAVDPVGGATYSWTVQGGTLLSGAGTERILLALGSGNSVKVSVVVNSPSCGAQNGTAFMALQDPFAIQSMAVTGGTHAGQPRTLTWSFKNGEPAAQVLTGTDFAQPVVLPGSARGYTYTPSLYGDKSVALDASTVALPGRSRAAGHGGTPSSSCTIARAEAKFHVDCNTPDATISAPGSVGVGLPFTASVKLPAGTSASWSIANGSPSAATGASVAITPTGGAPVEVHVVVSAGTCTAESAAQVKVDSALGCAVVPQATLALTSADCDKGVISVRLAGTPPFSGTWSDGEPFSAPGFTAERTVTAPADYTIKGFRDALCPGLATSLKVALKPTATLSTSGSACLIGGDSTAVITFTGTPPFLGEWSDSIAFNTTAGRLERKITAPIDLTLKWFQDSKCDGLVSGRATFGVPGTANVSLVSPANGCLAYGNDPSATARIAVDLIGTPPFTVKWSDGIEQSTSASQLLRFFAPQPGKVYTLRVSSARDAFCDLTLQNASATVGVTLAPQVSIPYLSCPNQETSAKLTGSVPVGATFNWHIDHGTIKSGQGLSTITFVPAAGITSATLSVDVNDPQSCTATTSVPVPFPPPPSQVKLTANPMTIALGQSTTVTVTMDPSNTFYTIVNLYTPAYQSIGYCQNASTCSYTVTPTVRGGIDIQAFGMGNCSQVWFTHAAINVNVQ